VAHDDQPKDRPQAGQPGKASGRREHAAHLDRLMGTPAGRVRPRPGHSARELQAQDASTGPATQPAADHDPRGDLLDPLQSFREDLSQQVPSTAADAAGPEGTSADGPSVGQAKATGDQSAPSSDSDAEAVEADGSRPREDGEGDQWRMPDSFSSDDPLVGSLTILCKLLGRSVSPHALTAGLPLEDGLLTPELLVRASDRVGLTARMMRWPLKRIRPQHMPCVLLLTFRRACVLAKIEKDRAYIILPEADAGLRVIPLADLQHEYTGFALLAQPRFQFDERAESANVPNPQGWFWGAILRSWPVYSEVVIASCLINLFALASPLFIMNVYDRVVPNFAEDTLWVLALGVAIVIGFDFILKTLRSHFVDFAGKTADTRIANRLFEQVLGMKMADRPNSAGALANSLREFEHLREFFTSSTLTAIVDLPFVVLFILIISWVAGPQIAAIPAIAVPVVMIVGALLQLPLKRAVSQTFREAQQKHAILIEAITGIETIKSTAAESQMQRSWETFVDMTAQSAASARRWSSLASHCSGMAVQFVTVGVVVYGVYLIHDGLLSVGALVASTILANRAMAPMSQVAGILTRFHQARVALLALDDLMRARVERPEGSRFVSRPRFAGGIEFRNVTFRYPGQSTSALTNLSFRIAPGERVGILGRIGSGKSTIERLVDGVYDPTEGAVLIDGTDVRQLDPADLRRNVGVVPQDIYLFHGTVRDNITIGAPHTEDRTVLRAAQIAGVDEFVSRHPQGFDLQVGERGQNLSGGQRQSVAVARALLTCPPILILDEPTSAMDSTSEARFKARLERTLGDSTLLLVTHRRSLLSIVDRLIVVDGGRVVADGPKAEILEALAAGRVQVGQS